MVKHPSPSVILFLNRMNVDLKERKKEKEKKIWCPV
jgi:hypothetical protein